MEGRSAVWLLAALLLEALISAETQNSLKYQELGATLDLSPESGLFTGSIRSISWKLNDSIVAVLDEGQELLYNPVFGGRAKVDTTTGVLEIRNTMKNESGVYKVAINNKIQVKGYDVRVIKQVPKPVLVVSPNGCTNKSESCSLICHGDITDAEPVIFYFKRDGDWKKEEGTTILIDEETRDVKTFSCRMENPLGHKDSEPVKNPFYVEPYIWKIVVGVVVGGIAAAFAGVVFWMKKRKNDSKTTTTDSTKDNGNPGEPLTNSSPDPKDA